MNTATGICYIILIPSYQPGQALITVTSKLLIAHFTVVVVDDGSEAQYQKVFQQLDARVYVLHHAVNQGKGAALKTGYQYIRSTFDDYIVITVDGDGQHATEDIEKMAEVYADHPHTLLLGVRTFEDTNVPLRSKFGNVLTRKVFSLITKQPLSDTQTGLRAFDKSLMDFMIDIPGERFEYEMSVLLACSSEGVDIAEVPIQTIYTDNNASSHFNPIKDSWAIYKEVIKFASSSLLAFVIDYCAFVILVHLTASWTLASSVVFANIMARIASASVNFTVNRHLVFRQHKTSVAIGAVQYVALASIILVGNTFFVTLLTGTIHVAPYIAKIITEVTFFSVSYLVQKHIIFAQKGALKA